MKPAARARLTVALGMAAAMTVLGLSGCGRLGTGSGDPAQPEAATAAEFTELSWEGQALEAIGFSPTDLAPVAAVAEPTPQPSARPGGDRPLRHHRRLRFWFHKRMLHGEAVVQTDEGTKTVVAQRGTVTAINDTSITVRSSDGFTLTWTFGERLRVLERRSQVQPTAIAVGRVVGVAGEKDGDKVIARLIVVPLVR